MHTTKNVPSRPGFFSMLPIIIVIAILATIGYVSFINPNAFDSVGETRGMSFTEDLEYQLKGGK